MLAPILRRTDIVSLRGRLRPELLGGTLLVGATLLALVWANSPWAGAYHGLWSARFSVQLGEWSLSKPLVVWVNDALMAVFFLLVGLEIKREFLAGALMSWRKAALPMAAALGGMVVPAVLYLLLNLGGPGEAGWGVPMATDIAFALGLLAIVGRGAPLELKVFLAAVAIVDDLGAILVIAIAYSSDLVLGALLASVAFMALLVLANRVGVRSAWPYMVLGVGLWYALLRSGVHATVAGVLLAATIPMHEGGPRAESRSLLHRMEHGLGPWVAFLIVPVFALANAGVTLGAAAAARLLEPVSLGIILGLVLGKPAGILSFSWIAVRAGIAELPTAVSWRHLQATAALAGVGFTMALFIGGLAFDDAALLDQAKTAILAASVIAAVLARVLFATATRTHASVPESVGIPVPPFAEADEGRRDEAA
jgi:NhaA family Na+:H+ antiporter